MYRIKTRYLVIIGYIWLYSHPFILGALWGTIWSLLINRDDARSFLQKVADAVGTVALLKEEDWQYSSVIVDVKVKTVSIGMDGTCMLLCEDGYRQAMVGTLAFYDKGGVAIAHNVNVQFNLIINEHKLPIRAPHTQSISSKRPTVT